MNARFEFSRRIRRLATAALFAAILPAALPAGAQAPDPCKSKSAAEFARLIEQNDFWRRSTSEAGEKVEAPDLDHIRWRAPALQWLRSYSRVHFDYGRPLRTRDPMHRFTLLELVFSEETEIPFHNGARLQAYPLASRATEDRPAFPLEEFAELVHHPVRWERREYVDWQAVRCGETVYLVYTIPVEWMDEIPSHARRLRSYLEIDSDATMTDFIVSLLASKAESRIDYDMVADLQRILADCGFEPGPVDGIWGARTESALAEFLRATRIAPPDAELDSLEEISEHVRRFQSEWGLMRTGRCDAMTLRRFSRLCGEGEPGAPR